MIQPGGFVFPTCRKLQPVVRFARRMRALEIPNVLQNEGMIFLFVFVANEVSRIRRGNVHDLGAHVGNQFASLHRGHGHFRAVLFFHFVIFSLRRDAPRVQVADFGEGVKRNDHGAEVAASGPQNLVGLAHQSFDPVR